VTLSFLKSASFLITDWHNNLGRLVDHLNSIAKLIKTKDLLEYAEEYIR